MKIKILLFFLFLFSFSILPQEPNLLENARNVFLRHKNIAIDFVYENSNINGKILYSGAFGEKLIFGNYEILVKNDTVFNLNKKLNRLVISPKDDEYSNFSLKNILFDLPNKCNINTTKMKIELSPKNPENENFKKVIISFSKEKLPEKIIFYGTDDNKFIFKILNYDFNINLDEKDFLLETNGKTKIIDFR